MKTLRLIVCIASAIVLTGCKSVEVVEVERVNHDTLYMSKLIHDSVIVTDSVVLKEKGDTVWFEKWHTQWRERIVRDTVHHHHLDSVPVPYPVEKPVEKQLTWWQKTQMYAGDALLTFTPAIFILWLLRLRRKWKNIRREA